MGLLNFEQILDADDMKTIDVEVPEWGGSIRLRSLTGAERDAFEAESVELDKKGQPIPLPPKNFRAKLIARCAINEDGTKLFNSKLAVEALGNKSASVLTRLAMECQKLNGMSEDEVEEAVEDFDGDPSTSSTSD
jgi:hypothetical protein